ncbi:MAG: PKD domain-containing protein, partial [Phycisphaerae bacterium]
MHPQRRCLPVVLVTMIAAAAVSAAIWSGCTFFSAPLSADAGVNAAVMLGQSITLQGSATGGLPPYSYSWTPAAGLNNASIAQPVFTPTTVGTRIFTLTVTDALGATAFASVSITVQSSSPALVANAGPDLSTTVNVPVMLQGSASGGNGQYSYAWSAPAGVTLQGADTATPVFTPATAGTFVFTLTVRDTEGTSATDTMSVTVAGQDAITSLTWAADYTSGGYRVVAVFAQALTRSSAQTTSNYRVTGTSTTPTSAALGADNRTVTLTFDVALASTSQFDLSVNNGIQDAGGNPIPAILGRTPDRNTADTTPPAVSSAAWGALISSGYQVNIVFSEALDRTSAQTVSAYRVTGTGTLAHSATLGSDGKTVTVVFTGVTLTSSSHIDIGVGGIIRDINGNAMSASLDHAVSGTISTETTVSTVAWGADYAAGGYQVLVTFNQAVDSTT